ncbi:putative bifunctional diguanylate cyclase/phosphodiesterase [Salinivibrio sp. IB643]|uniref:putative bifunctional diguanylate cyclase/phosphodiesterase n=1 Tax=Salinivibrio TaxID=51366 RepID=UPI00098917DF|nr:EAL domain-containing protein [Salinivibrio sp. IB643]OOF00068.1 diguanylate cyclase [Salinivibrio sp. IB643]
MKKTAYYALKLALIYFFFASLWVLFSDKLVNVLSDNLEMFTWAQSLKGLLFVVITSVLLWALAQKNYRDLERASDIDTVTGLHSPSVFIRRADTLLQHANAESCYTLFVLDIDDYTSVTNKLGFDRTNQLLIGVARKIDTPTVPENLTSRIHSDRFACLLTLPNVSEMTPYIDKLHRQCNQFLQRYDRDITCSVGVAVFDSDGEDTTALMTAATRALNEAKKHKNAVAYHDIYLTEEAKKRQNLVNDLKQAIDTNKIDVVFQPQYHVVSGQLSGLEVLARWTHDQYGNIPPSVFIPLAEEQHFCEDLTALVLEKATKQLNESQLLGNMVKRVSVNISAVEFNSVDAIARIDTYLQSNPEFARYLCLEITETAALDDIIECARVVDTLKRHGVTFSIDDFGVGYTSLGMFNRINVDEIKIDRSFIQAMETDSRAKAITAGIIDIAKRLDINVVAEGVETHTQLMLLKQLDCQHVQGFYLGYPAPLEQLAVAQSV